MRSFLVVVAACGGGTTAAPVENTAPAQAAERRCTVIPEGTYLFAAAATEDALMGSGEPAGRCVTGFAGAAQEITCEQPSPPIKLRGTFEAREGVHLASTTFGGQLSYSDAVVLLGSLRNAAGDALFVRLELDCESVDACMAAMQNARTCK